LRILEGQSSELLPFTAPVAIYQIIKNPGSHVPNSTVGFSIFGTHILSWGVYSSCGPHILWWDAYTIFGTLVL